MKKEKDALNMYNNILIISFDPYFVHPKNCKISHHLKPLSIIQQAISQRITS